MRRHVSWILPVCRLSGQCGIHPLFPEILNYQSGGGNECIGNYVTYKNGIMYSGIRIINHQNKEVRLILPPPTSPSVLPQRYPSNPVSSPPLRCHSSQTPVCPTSDSTRMKKTEMGAARSCVVEMDSERDVTRLVAFRRVKHPTRLPAPTTPSGNSSQKNKPRSPPYPHMHPSPYPTIQQSPSPWSVGVGRGG